MSALSEFSARPIDSVYALRPETADFLRFHSGVAVLEDGPRFKIVNEYARLDLAGSQDRAYIREALALRLAEVAEQLPPGCKLVIFDAFRSRETQRALFEKTRGEMAQRHPGYTEEQLFDATKEFVANPYDHSRVLPHNTGGAVDLGILGPNGKPWDFGTRFDELAAPSITRHFEAPYDPASGMSAERWQTARENRRTLFHLMAGAGFTNNKDEWWHFDLGDNMWAKNVGQAPAYDSMEPQVNALKKPLWAGLNRSIIRAESSIGARIDGFAPTW